MSTPKPVIRCESHRLATSAKVRDDIERTIAGYRRIARALCTVLMTHWPELARAKSKPRALEALLHPTAKRPVVKYPGMSQMLGKMPSYPRRAAIEHAYGVVSSFQSNWDNSLDGEVGARPRQQGARGPRLGLSGVYPSLYGGNMITYDAGLRTVCIKLLGAVGQWRIEGCSLDAARRIASEMAAFAATFPSGKQCNTDLNGALNIAVRGCALLLGLAPQRNEQMEQQAASGKSSGAVARIPLVLADVWAYHE